MKIPTLFVRNERDRRYVIDVITPGCEWVFEGEGVALRMYDGVCVKKDADGEWWARYAATPTSAEWVPIRETWRHFAAFQEAREASPTPHVGTYELCGPTINGNPEGLSWAGLVFHNHAQRMPPWLDFPDNFVQLRREMTAPEFTFEGIVWRHRDGRMAKLKKKDFIPTRFEVQLG